ncbi:MAG: TRAP transporter substrate-binding protein DctP [Pseudolabrys sp.]
MTNTPMVRFPFFATRRIAMAGSFVGVAAWIGVLGLALLPPLAASAAPVELKLSFFASEKIDAFRYGVKPFVDAVNAEGKGLVAIKVYPNGALGKAVAEQPGLVLEGVADIAWIVPGQTPYRFPDNQALELPGVFQGVREGTLVYTNLIAANALRGYEKFFVIGAYTSDLQVIHSRKPTSSLAAVEGQKIRANNGVEAEALARFGAIPTVMPASRLADGLAQGAIDAVVMTPGGLFQFGAERSVANHYLLNMGVAPLVLVMNRKKFDSLPATAQALIRKFSGKRAAAIWIEAFGTIERGHLEKMKMDATQKVVEPSTADLKVARQVYKSLMDAWAAKSARNRELLKTIEADLAAIRTGNR